MIRTPHNCRWVVVSVNKPVMMRRSDDETWLLNPRRRYILNADVIQDLAPYIESVFDLLGSSFHKPLHTASPVRLPGAAVLVERYRELADDAHPTCTEEEYPVYVWADVKPGAERKADEQPVKEYDHGMDCSRYAVAHFDLQKRLATARSF